MHEHQLGQESAEVQRKIAEHNPWYTSDQLATQRYGVYRHNMQLRYAYVARMLAFLNINVNGQTVVDLGCGDGQWSLELSRHHQPHLIGIDYNPLRLARYQTNIQTASVHAGSCLDIPLPEATADIVMFHQVLEHIPEAERALQQIHRILKPEGWLMLSVPNEGSWLKQQVQYRWLEPHALATSDHVNFYTPATLKTALEAAGFYVRRLDSLGFYFPYNGVSRRIVSRRWSFQLGLYLAHVIPCLRDCLFAWCQPVKSGAKVH
jgi:ubiquinone/menaquinone biosynthesis C-methylase UbiE